MYFFIREIFNDFCYNIGFNSLPKYKYSESDKCTLKPYQKDKEGF